MNTTTNAVAMADLSRATREAAETAINANVDINNFRPYDSALPVPSLEGYRTVKCLYKVNKATGKAAGDNSYIRVPDSITEKEVAAQIAELAPYIVGWLQSQEDMIVKELHKGGATSIKPEQLGLANVLSYLESTASSSRLNGEAIAAWFLDDMRDNLAVAFADKMGLGEEPTAAELEKLEAILSTYEAKYKSLASGKTVYRKEEAELLQKALTVTGADKTLIGTRFMNRLEQMKSATPDDLLLAL